ncbi:MAG: type II secretion system major pseudopilin GspG [Candidatus Ratteibacteria bacterium]|jgi:general secretion pathway protein G
MDPHNQYQNRKKGFTLIELLLVLVILSTLAAIVVPKFTRRTEQARITAAKSDIAGLEVALDSYEVDTGTLPATDEGLSALVEPPSSVQNWNGPYIKRGMPVDPWGNPYLYKSPGDHNTNSYDLSSFGPDGKEGGGDDIDNWSSF